MVDKSKKRKKGIITEKDASNLLDRYSAQTVFALLKEVSLASGGKIDWDDAVKNTATGITCAREYHKLWRHLAYGGALANRIEISMDDDSDLEYDVEAFPPVGREAATEASACVKVLSQMLIVSANANDSALQENRIIEGPLPINVPNCSGSQGSNIIIPVPIEIQPMSTGNGVDKKTINKKSDAKMPSRRKKKAWSAKEDMKLAAAVEKYGEDSWASIARIDFDNERNSGELSQRWINLKKQKANSKVGTNSQHSETQLAATHRALSLALDFPVRDNGGISSLNQSLDQQLPVRPGLSNAQLPTVLPPKNLSSGPDSRIKAAAVAAGARIASSADASSLMEAARSQNVVHITTGGGSSGMMKSSVSSLTSQLPSNVHFLCNGLAKNPISAASNVSKPNVSRPGQAQQHQQQGQSAKPSALVVQTNKMVTVPVLSGGNASARLSSVNSSKTGEDNTVVSTSTNETAKVVQRDLEANKPVTAQVEQNAGDLTTLLPNQSDVSGSGHANTLENQNSTSILDPVGQTTDNRAALSGSKD